MVSSEKPLSIPSVFCWIRYALRPRSTIFLLIHVRNGVIMSVIAPRIRLVYSIKITVPMMVTGTGDDLNQCGVEHFSDRIHIVCETAHDITGRSGEILASFFMFFYTSKNNFKKFIKSCPILSLPIQSIPTQMETQNFIMKKRAGEVRLPSDHKMKE